jgi:hypothetical protein
MSSHNPFSSNLTKTPNYIKQEQELKDALEKAHYSNPQMCDPNTCVHCSNDRLHDWCQSRNLGTYT